MCFSCWYVDFVDVETIFRPVGGVLNHQLILAKHKHGYLLINRIIILEFQSLKLNIKLFGWAVPPGKPYYSSDKYIKNASKVQSSPVEY